MLLKSHNLNGEANFFSVCSWCSHIESWNLWHTDTAKRQYSRPAQPITFATFAQDVLQGSAQVSRFTNRRTILLVYHRWWSSFHTERERMIAQISIPSKHKIILIAKLIPFLRLQKRWFNFEKKGSTSWCNDNPLRRKEEDKEDNAEDEEAVMKARAVDDWKDYNPCRACNQKLTTCD